MAAAVAAVIGSGYPFLLAHTGGQGIPCPLRTLTGVPCPCCGMTTAMVAITHGDWLAAARANPAVYLLAGLVASTAPLLLARVARWAAPPRPWPAARRRRTGQVMTGVATASELFQLHRFGFL
jgi:Protein of unknown function (DUF2752)